MNDVTVEHFKALAAVRHNGSRPNPQRYAQILEDLCTRLEEKSVLVGGPDDFPIGLLSGRRLAIMHFDKDGCTITGTATGAVHKFDVVQKTKDENTFRYLKYVGDCLAELRRYDHFTPIEELAIKVAK